MYPHLHIPIPKHQSYSTTIKPLRDKFFHVCTNSLKKGRSLSVQGLSNDASKAQTFAAVSEFYFYSKNAWYKQQMTLPHLASKTIRYTWTEKLMFHIAFITVFYSSIISVGAAEKAQENIILRPSLSPLVCKYFSLFFPTTLTKFFKAKF